MFVAQHLTVHSKYAGLFLAIWLGSLFVVFMMDETLLFHGAAAPAGLANAMAVSVAKVLSSTITIASRMHACANCNLTLLMPKGECAFGRQ